MIAKKETKMCKAYEITRKTLKNLFEKKEFGKEELRKIIIENGGVMRIRSGYTVKDYLNDLERRGLISYFPREKMYKVNNNARIFI
jgi:hypothetical protein